MSGPSQQSYTGLFFKLGVAAGLVFGIAALVSKTAKAETVPPAIKSVTVDGQDYIVIRRGQGQYEVILDDDRDTWLIFGQGGPIEQHGDSDKLAKLEADMRQFPADLFQE